MRQWILVLLLLFVCAAALSATQVPIYLMTKPEPTTCDQPVAYTTFLSTDPAAFLWFRATDASKNDVFEVDYYNPSGAFYAPASVIFDPLDSPGNWCLMTEFDIAGQPPASNPGLWKVIGKLNGSQMFTLTFSITASGGPTTSPAINPGGIVNAASNRAGIARGSFFTIYGDGIGPVSSQTVASFPAPDTMGGVVVQVTQGASTKRAYLHYVSAKQINAILPSNVSLGSAQVTVTYGGKTSAAEPVTIVDTQFGIFSTAGGSGPGIIQNWNSSFDQPLNTPSHTAKPGQLVIAWGTGLGPINTGDNTPAPGGDMTAIPVQILVGGKVARRVYSGRAPTLAGVDNVYFEVPADAPAGCSVPVQVQAGKTWSNTVRMAIHATGQHCQDVANPFGDMMSKGGKTGGIILMRAGLSGQLDPSQPPIDVTLDLGLGTFSDIPAGGELAFSPLLNLPPVGTCVSTERSIDLAALLSDPSTLGLGVGRQLNAGAQLQVSGIKGNKPIAQLDAKTSPGLYLGILGGTLPLPGTEQLPPFLEGGSFTVTGSGGPDVGAFRATVNMGSQVNWNNRSQLTTITRASGATVTWTGGDSSQVVLLAGGSTNQDTKASGGFFCLSPATSHSFTIPAATLADVPPTGATAGLSGSLGAVMVLSLPMASQKFTAPGLDTGFGFAATASIAVVQFK